MKPIIRIAILSSLLFGTNAFANTVFEAYYRLERKATPVGFLVIRREVDPKSKIQTIKYFLQTVDTERASHRIQLTEKVDRDLKPLEYHLLQSGDNKPEKMDVSFSKPGSYDVTTQTKSFKPETKTGEMPDGAFLSVQLEQVLALAKPIVGRVYYYHAMNETYGKVMDGQVTVLGSSKNGKHRMYRTFGDFEVPPEENWFLEDGQLIASAAPDRDVTAFMVRTPDEALSGLDFNKSDLISLFGEIPRGDKNALVAKEVNFDKAQFRLHVDTSFKRVANPMPLTLKATSKTVR